MTLTALLYTAKYADAVVFGVIVAMLLADDDQPTKAAPYGAVPLEFVVILLLNVAAVVAAVQWTYLVLLAVVLATVPEALLEYLNVAVTVAEPLA